MRAKRAKRRIGPQTPPPPLQLIHNSIHFSVRTATGRGVALIMCLAFVFLCYMLILLHQTIVSRGPNKTNLSLTYKVPLKPQRL